MSLLRSRQTLLTVTPAGPTAVGSVKGIQPNFNDDVPNHQQGFLLVAHVVQTGAGTVDCLVEGSVDGTNFFSLFATTQTTANGQARNQVQNVAQMPPFLRATMTAAGGATGTALVYLLSDGSFTLS